MNWDDTSVVAEQATLALTGEGFGYPAETRGLLSLPYLLRHLPTTAGLLPCLVRVGVLRQLVFSQPPARSRQGRALDGEMDGGGRLSFGLFGRAARRHRLQRPVRSRSVCSVLQGRSERKPVAGQRHRVARAWELETGCAARHRIICGPARRDCSSRRPPNVLRCSRWQSTGRPRSCTAFKNAALLTSFEI